jgi:hypothetical protein
MQRFKAIDPREPIPDNTPCELCDNGETKSVAALVDLSVYGNMVGGPDKITYICGNHAELLDDGRVHFYESNS